MTAHLTERVAKARRILALNDRGGYTVPTDRLYPFQWNWDSAFVAMGWATFDTDRAWREIERLLEGQWDNGLIPQIVFHAPSDDYFPGPDVWGTQQDPPTSGITQPPVLATAVRRVLDATEGDESQARAAALYPRLLANHRWWEQARDPGRTGLVATLHPWETGMDNSPAWDAALERVPTETATPIRRRDTTHVDAAFRPRGAEYQRFIHLVDLFRDAGWKPERMLALSPFKVADIGTNAILLRAERDLLALAQRFGSPADVATIAERIERKERAISGLWHAPSAFYLSRDLTAEEPIAVRTSAGFLPLFAGLAEHEAALAAHLARWRGQGHALVPSTDPEHPAFEPLRYWRGPVWVVVNWMIAEGFRLAGNAVMAAAIDDATRDLIGDAGWSEYFDPVTRRGIGGTTFSWTAAIDLMLSSKEATR
ncbi:MGH1-like glycoside hydrolase domain-containing protein [Bosea sp. (in: a-proteobacteria)]|jgi:glycogen debranching enzyme|uniref:MGH1-like glycoside hydrolase domain-containing protein n=1 Tax=Bosea sp. (in: a-proteobacteria) TaxID=1871050 RepID=UPI003F6FD0B7